MLDCRVVRTDFNCDSCYEVTIDNCAEIIINAQLNPDETYYLNLYDQFEIKRTIEIITDENGVFQIDQSLLPDNYFNPFGNYDFYISINEDGSDTVALIFEGEEYLCGILIIE